MPAVLEMPKALSKQEEFVEKQIEHARQRIRRLDWFAAGLKLLIVSFAFLFAVLLIDHYIETPAGTGWAALALYLVCGSGYLYLLLYRPSRRQINPFYAARHVERTLTDAKNSVVNYVDLKDDEKVPGSVKTAIGIRAAKDLKHVDLNQIIQKKQVTWLVGFAGLFFAAAVVAAFLPPTRTTMSLVSPKDGNTTIVQGEDFRLDVELKGRVPKTSDPDAARIRLWYNPDDPASYEERILEPVEGQKRTLSATIPAKQVRNGFQYKVLAGTAQSADFEVKVHIIPQFTGWTVEYEYPEYKQLAVEKTNDPNLAGFYGTKVTLTALTNRPVKSGTVEIDGQVEKVVGELLPDNPEAIVFRFPMLRSSTYRIHFVTVEGHQNPDPQHYRLELADPKPLILNYDVTYDYPKYLRADSVTFNAKRPDLEAYRGTKVTLVAHANRPVSDGDKKPTVEFPGADKKIVGVVDPKNPTQVTFSPLEMKQDGDYRVAFWPKTNEGQGQPGVFKVRVLTDEPPQVSIDKPHDPEIELPANSTLAIEGRATDDHGVDKVILHMEVIKPDNAKRILAEQPYRGGKSFRRESDGSYPTQLEYKDFVDLAKVKAADKEGERFQLKEGMVIEYWLEAIDNCDVPPCPNRGYSEHKRVKILAPQTVAEKQKKQQDVEREQKRHEQKQDNKNANEERKRPQPNPQGDQSPQQGGAKKEPAPKQDAANPMEKGNEGNQPKQDMGNQPPMDGQLNKQQENLEEALNKADPTQPPDMGTNPPMPPANPSQNNGTNPPMPPADPSQNNGMNPPMPPANPSQNNGMNPPMPPANPSQNNGMNPPMPPANPSQNNGTNPPMPPANPSQNNGMNPPMPPANPSPNSGGSSDTQSNSGSGSTPQDLNNLAEKLDSNDPKEQEQARDQVRKMMKQNEQKPQDPVEQQKKTQEQRDKLDQLEKEKFDQSNKRIQDEMEKLSRERNEREERVKNAAKKAQSDDEKTRKEGQKEIEKELQNQSTRDDVDKQLQNLAGDTPDKTKRQRLDAARNLSRSNIEKKERDSAQQQMPKKNDVDELAKKMKNGNEQEKKDARNELEKKLSDPSQRKQVEQDLENHAKGLSGEEKKDFEKQTQQMKDDVANKEQAQQQTQSPQDLNNLADKLRGNDKEKQEARAQLRKSMEQTKNNPPNPDAQKKKFDDYRDKLGDQLEKDKFDESMKQIGQEMQKMQREDRVKSAADKAKSDDPMQRAQGQKEMEKELQNPATRADVNRQLQQLAGDTADPKQQQNLNDAMNLARNNVKNQENANSKPVPPKKEDDDVAKLAKKMQHGSQQEKKDAQDKLEKKLGDPNQGEQAKKDLENYKNGLSGDEKKEFEQKMQQMKDSVAKNNPGNKQPTPSADDIKKFADKLANGSKEEKQEAQKQLGEAMKQADNDPKAGKQASDQIKQVRDSIKDESKKAEFDKAIDEIGKAVGEQRQQQQAKAKEEAGQLAKDLNSKDEAIQKAARQKLQEMLNDPKKKETVKDELNNAKQNASPEDKQNIDKALRQAEQNIAKEDGKSAGQPSKEDIKKLANDLNSKDSAIQKKASEKLEKLLGDPKQQQGVKDELENIKKNTDDATTKKNIDEAVKKAVQNIAKKDGQKGDASKLDPKEIEKLIKQMQSKDAKDVGAAEKKIDELMQDPAKRAALENKLDEMMKDPKKRGEVEKAIQDYMKNQVDKLAQQLQNGTPEQQKQAREQIEKLTELKDLMDKFAKKNDGKGGGDVANHEAKKPGDPGYQEPQPGSLPDLKNKVKAGELTLEKFQKNITNEEFRKDAKNRLKMTDEELDAFLKKYEQHVKALKAQVEAVEKEQTVMPRMDGPSPLNNQQAEKIRIEGKDGPNVNAGSKFTPPPGFGDSYRRFTDEVSGNAQPAAPPKK